MDNTKAIALLRRMQEPEAYEPQITADAFEALGMAIKALEQASFPRSHENDHFAEVSKKATQPEPPDVPDTNVGDTISRQAAIDALEEPRKMSDTWTDEYAVGERMQWEKDVKALNSLPFVQPEQRCVNCGRTANNGGWYKDGRTRCPIEEHYALPKDGHCHLWEKRNVTDDDYPERRTDEYTD